MGACQCARMALETGFAKFSLIKHHIIEPRTCKSRWARSGTLASRTALLGAAHEHVSSGAIDAAWAAVASNARVAVAEAGKKRVVPRRGGDDGGDSGDGDGLHIERQGR